MGSSSILDCTGTGDGVETLEPVIPVSSNVAVATLLFQKAVTVYSPD